MGRDMLKIFLFLLCYDINIVSSSLESFHYSKNKCNIGDVIKNECVLCLCTPKAFFECQLLDCNKTTGFKELEIESNPLCIPNQSYVQNLITCICNKDGTWPHKNCLQTFLSLPLIKIKKHTCKPNTYVEIDCNVCRCGPDEKIIPTRCTKNDCEEKPSRRIDLENDSRQSNVYSNCIVKNWYSLAPCQFCFCVNENKLVCNTGHYYAKKLDVGKYNMEICGTEMINEALELIPYEQRNQVQGVSHITNKIATAATTAEETSPTESNPTQNKNYLRNRIKITRDDEKSGDDESSSSGSDDNQDDQSSEEGEKSDDSPPGMIDVEKNEQTVEDNDNASNSKDESDDKDSKDSHTYDIAVDITRSKGKADSETRESAEKDTEKNSKHQKPTTRPTIEDLEFVNNTLKINVPNVLNKVFEMALRKSMVSLNSKTHCNPGATYMHDCNMCFCLKNGKELCTANKCP